MIGTRPTDRNKTYHHHTCWNLARYDASTCNFTRLNADEVDTAILDALATFHRTRHDLIHDAITAQLTTIDNETTKTRHAIDRYLAAFERGTIDENLAAERLTELRTKTQQLHVRRDELALALALDNEPTTPAPATLTSAADHITEIILSGSHNQIKALLEDLIAHVTITGPDQLRPVFHTPQPLHNDNRAASALPAENDPKAYGSCND